MTRATPYEEGHAKGLAGDRTTRGLMLLGLGMAGNFETIRNTRAWLAGFRAAQIKRGGGDQAFHFWREAFMAEIVCRGVWTPGEIERSCFDLLVDGFVDKRDPVLCARAEIRTSRAA